MDLFETLADITRPMDRDIQPDEQTGAKELTDVQFYPDSGVLEYTIRSTWAEEHGWEWEDETRSIDPDSDEFLDILPKGEYKFKDDNGYICARVDKFFNIHYLVEDFKGFVQYRTVNLKKILL